MDLYWAVIDSAHAALMVMGEVPPSPSHVGELMHEKLIKPGLIHKDYSKTMDKFYGLAKKISGRQIITIPGKDYDQLYNEANDFVEAMHKFIEDRRHLKH
jgi:uncharacterized protein (UPF0332 family)